MRNPRNDQTIIDRLCAERDATCPSWWGCLTRGCYEQAKENYANGGGDRRQKWERDLATGARDDGAINGYGSK